MKRWKRNFIENVMQTENQNEINISIESLWIVNLWNCFVWKMYLFAKFHWICTHEKYVEYFIIFINVKFCRMAVASTHLHLPSSIFHWKRVTFAYSSIFHGKSDSANLFVIGSREHVGFFLDQSIRQYTKLHMCVRTINNSVVNLTRFFVVDTKNGNEMCGMRDPERKKRIW